MEITLNLRSQSLRGELIIEALGRGLCYDLKKSFEKRNEYIQLVILQYLTKQRYFIFDECNGDNRLQEKFTESKAL